MKYYIVWDGRYLWEEDCATIIEMLGERKTDEEAISEIRNYYAGLSYVLVKYDEEAGSTLVNAEVVPYE